MSKNGSSGCRWSNGKLISRRSRNSFLPSRCALIACSLEKAPHHMPLITSPFSPLPEGHNRANSPLPEGHTQGSSPLPKGHTRVSSPLPKGHTRVNSPLPEGHTRMSSQAQLIGSEMLPVVLMMTFSNPAIHHQAGLVNMEGYHLVVNSPRLVRSLPTTM